jgi:ferredoxin
LFEGQNPVGLNFQPGRCVHAGPVAASCVACLSACPRDALALGDDGIVLDANRCDDCGLCVAVCPRRVFSLPLNLVKGEIAGHAAHFAACEILVTEPVLGRVPCLNAIGLDDLLRARQSGIHAWIVARGDCEGCARGKGPSWLARVADLNAALAARGKPGLVVREMTEASWRTLFRAGVRLGDSAVSARRGFLRRVLPAASDEAPVASCLEGEGPYPWSIFLDAGRCVACHACVRTCPEEAIHLDEMPTPVYRLDHAACTGCGVCLDVCDRSAVRPLSWRQPDVAVVPLHAGNCRACGVPYLSTSTVDARGLCHICVERPSKNRLSRVCE